MRGGLPASAFDATTEYEIQKCATLDVMISSGPVWFKKLKEKNQNFSWRDVPDPNFVDEVYAKALRFRQEIQTELTGTKKAFSNRADTEVSVGVSADVADGVFSDVSSSKEVS